MMTKDEALKMVNQVLDDKHHYPDEDIPTLVLDALNACKEALEQPAQEPLTRAQQVIRANNTAQPTQEPVAWGNPKYNYAVHHKVKSAWQGLTDDEIQELTHDGVADEYDIKFARAVLAKAKEKNYYGPT